MVVVVVVVVVVVLKLFRYFLPILGTLHIDNNSKTPSLTLSMAKHLDGTRNCLDQLEFHFLDKDLNTVDLKGNIFEAVLEYSVICEFLFIVKCLKRESLPNDKSLLLLGSDVELVVKKRLRLKMSANEGAPLKRPRKVDAGASVRIETLPKSVVGTRKIIIRPTAIAFPHILQAGQFLR